MSRLKTMGRTPAVGPHQHTKRKLDTPEGCRRSRPRVEQYTAPERGVRSLNPALLTVVLTVDGTVELVRLYPEGERGTGDAVESGWT